MAILTEDIKNLVRESMDHNIQSKMGENYREIASSIYALAKSTAPTEKFGNYGFFLCRDQEDLFVLLYLKGSCRHYTYYLDHNCERRLLTFKDNHQLRAYLNHLGVNVMGEHVNIMSAEMANTPLLRQPPGEACGQPVMPTLRQFQGMIHAHKCKRVSVNDIEAYKTLTETLDDARKNVRVVEDRNIGMHAEAYSQSVIATLGKNGFKLGHETKNNLGWALSTLFKTTFRHLAEANHLFEDGEFKFYEQLDQGTRHSIQQYLDGVVDKRPNAYHDAIEGARISAATQFIGFVNGVSSGKEFKAYAKCMVALGASTGAMLEDKKVGFAAALATAMPAVKQAVDGIDSSAVKLCAQARSNSRRDFCQRTKSQRAIESPKWLKIVAGGDKPVCIGLLGTGLLYLGMHGVDEYFEGARSQAPSSKAHPDLLQTCRSDRDPQDVAWSSRLRFCSSADPSGKTRFNMFERPEPSWNCPGTRASVLPYDNTKRSTRSDDISKRPEPCAITWALGRRVCRSALPYDKPRFGMSRSPVGMLAPKTGAPTPGALALEVFICRTCATIIDGNRRRAMLHQKHSIDGNSHRDFCQPAKSQQASSYAPVGAFKSETVTFRKHVEATETRRMCVVVSA